jgi:hypothetical protein
LLEVDTRAQVADLVNCHACSEIVAWYIQPPRPVAAIKYLLIVEHKSIDAHVLHPSNVPHQPGKLVHRPAWRHS